MSPPLDEPATTDLRVVAHAALLAAIVARLSRWTYPALRAIDYLTRLGPPLHLHEQPTAVPIERDDHHGVPAVRRIGDSVRADALTMWRGVCRAAGVPLPAPGAAK